LLMMKQTAWYIGIELENTQVQELPCIGDGGYLQPKEENGLQ
jgi:hypothetical protein